MYCSFCLEFGFKGASFLSRSRLFQKLAPRYEKDFWPFAFLKRGIARSVPEFLILLDVAQTIVQKDH